MRAAKGIQKPYIGGPGVYMHVLETTGGPPKPHYIGKADDLGKRWREHVLDWYFYPHEGYSTPVSAEDYLADPVDAINNERLKKCLPNRGETMRAILKQAWFCWAETDGSAGPRDVEYVLQEGAKQHWNIRTNGWIGDASNRPIPVQPLNINNHLMHHECRILRGTLPEHIHYTPGADVEI